MNTTKPGDPPVPTVPVPETNGALAWEPYPTLIPNLDEHLGGGVLRAFERRGGRYAAIAPNWIEEVGLGLTQWPGRYLDVDTTWLRWCDREGRVIPTGGELAAVAARRADTAEERIRR